MTLTLFFLANISYNLSTLLLHMRFNKITDVLLNVSFMLSKNGTALFKGNDRFCVCVNDTCVQFLH